MKKIIYIFEFIIIYLLFIIFKILGYRISSNFGFIIGKFFGPIFRAKSIVINNLKKAQISSTEYEIASKYYDTIVENYSESFNSVKKSMFTLAYVYANHLDYYTDAIDIYERFKKEYPDDDLIVSINYELENVKDIKAKYLSGGQKKKLVIALALLGDPKVLLLDECFAALDILTIKMIQEIIVNLQQENQITICICDHQARDLLACVDIAMILSNCKIVAHGSPSNLIKDINAQNAYFGNSFKIS